MKLNELQAKLEPMGKQEVVELLAHFKGELSKNNSAKTKGAIERAITATEKKLATFPVEEVKKEAPATKKEGAKKAPKKEAKKAPEPAPKKEEKKEPEYAPVVGQLVTLQEGRAQVDFSVVSVTDIEVVLLDTNSTHNAGQHVIAEYDSKEKIFKNDRIKFTGKLLEVK